MLGLACIRERPFDGQGFQDEHHEIHWGRLMKYSAGD